MKWASLPHDRYFVIDFVASAAASPAAGKRMARDSAG